MIEFLAGAGVVGLVWATVDRDRSERRARNIAHRTQLEVDMQGRRWAIDGDSVVGFGPDPAEDPGWRYLGQVEDLQPFGKLCHLGEIAMVEKLRKAGFSEEQIQGEVERFRSPLAQFYNPLRLSFEEYRKPPPITDQTD